MGELEAHRYTHEHAETSLIGHQRADRADTLALVLLTGYTVDLGVMGLPEPASLGKSFDKHALERRGGVCHHVLGVG